MEYSKRGFLKCVFIFILSANLFLLFYNPSSSGARDHEDLDKKTRKSSLLMKAKTAADSVLKRLPEDSADKIKSMSLLYDIHMEVEWGVKMKMSVTLKMEKENNGFISAFSLTEPVGKTLWSKFALFIYGKHTEEYKEMIAGIKTRIDERFRLKRKRFITDELKEILPEIKAYKNQAGVRVYFDYNENLVKFWEDQTQKDFSKSMRYTNQVGPMSGFFNFVLFERSEAELNIINALKQVEDQSDSEKTFSDQKKVNFLFDSQVVKLQQNSTGKHSEYLYAAYFASDNYLDIIYGRNIYYELAFSSTGNVKIPYAIHLDGIISKTKKRKRERRLKQLMDSHLDRRATESELRAIEAMGNLAAKNVKVYLREVKAVYE